MARRPLIVTAPVGQVPATHSPESPGVETPTPPVLYSGGYLEGDHIKLLYRDPAGELRVKQHVARFASYHRMEEDTHAAVLRELRGSNVVRRVLLDEPCREGGAWARVEWRDYDTRDKGVEWLTSHGVKNWEADVSPVKRHFADTTDATSPTPRVAFLDIETDSRVSFAKKEQMRILCWAVVSGTEFNSPVGSVQSGATWNAVLADDTDAAEAALLEELWATLAQFDVVSAWYGDGFDFPVIMSRSKRLGLGAHPRRWRWLDHLEVFRGMNQHVAETGDEKQSMALNAICQSVLGEGKHDFDASKSWDAWAAGGDARVNLANYNIQDTQLLWKLERKKTYVRLFGTICAACNIFVETKSLGAQQQVDGLMLRLGKQRGYHWPTRPKEKPGFRIPIKGALVMQPPEKAGILRGVHVVDFSGLYPSIMISWNMSPETLCTERTTRPTAKCPLTGTAFYTDQPGILTEALMVFRDMRKQWTEKKASLPPGTPEWHDADQWAMAYKIAANSMYGVTASDMGRYYFPKIGEGTTQNGVWLIKATCDEARKRGMNPLYLDTDSAFVAGVKEEEFREFTRWCNAELYPRLIKEQGCVVNTISLAYEKEFERLVFTAAKKYVGRYAHYKGKLATKESKPEIRGMEYKRGDAVLLARKLQGECIMLLMQDCSDDPEAYRAVVRRHLDHCLNDAIKLEEVVMAQTISMPLDEYKAATPPAHVRVAKMLKERGEDVSVGTKIQYVVIEAKAGPEGGGMKVIPAKDWTGEVDRVGLWEGRVWPPTMRLLENAFPHDSWVEFDKAGPKEARARKGKPGLEAQPSLFAKSRVLGIVAEEGRGFNDAGVAAVRAILELAREGQTPVEFTLKLAGGVVKMDVVRRVEVGPELLRRLRSLLGHGAVTW